MIKYFVSYSWYEDETGAFMGFGNSFMDSKVLIENHEIVKEIEAEIVRMVLKKKGIKVSVILISFIKVS